MRLLFLDERNLSDAGIHRQNILTLRALTAFANLVLDIANIDEDLTASLMLLLATEARVDTLEGETGALAAADALLEGRLDAAENNAEELQDQIAAPITIDSQAVKNIVFAGTGATVSVIGDTATVTVL